MPLKLPDGGLHKHGYRPVYTLAHKYVYMNAVAQVWPHLCLCAGMR